MKFELLATLHQAGLGPQDITAVALTGGTSHALPIQQMVKDIFGEEKV